MNAPSIASELDNLRFDAVAEYADLAASYWRSAAEAAFRGDRTTLEVHPDAKTDILKLLRGLESAPAGAGPALIEGRALEVVR
jgi:hypothetical protein